MMTAEHIYYKGITFYLNQKLEYQLRFAGKYYVLDCLVLGLSVRGETAEEAREAFYAGFYFLYETYASQDDQKLCDMGKEVKKLLNSMITSIEKSATSPDNPLQKG